ncbi:MAG TPA: transporter, partial [Acidobacteriaceae bacterium]|nr:transporter [Acidobacteriaceae bacterium]
MAFLLAAPQLANAQASPQNGFVARWLASVSRTQSEQPHWVTPIVLVTPRLEQEFRADFVRQLVAGGYENWVYDNGKGLEMIPARHIEMLVNLPPYLQHSAPNTKDGMGDMSFLMKYRILAKNEQKGNYILTAFFGGSVPTGTYKNGANSAQLTPTIAGGKGWGRFDIASTLGGTLPVDSVKVVGRSIVWNTAVQYHIGRYLWPELESNATYYKGGA